MANVEAWAFGHGVGLTGAPSRWMGLQGELLCARFSYRCSLIPVSSVDLVQVLVHVLQEGPAADAFLDQ